MKRYRIIEKCEFNKNEVIFFGLNFNSKGVSLKEDKIKALKEFKTPKDAAELQSFLGLSVYASRWIPDLQLQKRKSCDN